MTALGSAFSRSAMCPGSFPGPRGWRRPGANSPCWPGLDDRGLADIGLTRQDLRDATAFALSEPPSALPHGAGARTRGAGPGQASVRALRCDRSLPSEGVPRPARLGRSEDDCGRRYSDACISRHRAGGTPNSRLNARLNASSNSYPTE